MTPRDSNIGRQHWIYLVLALVAAVLPLQWKLLAEEPYRWDLPKGFPQPWTPPDNPMSQAKVDLGRRLFYDRRLSVNGSQSCGSCHRQELAFTDGKARAIGATGETHPRGSMSLVNVAYAPLLTWAHPMLRRLEDQARVPMFGTDPVELGLLGREEQVEEMLRAGADYRKLFAAAYPGEVDPFTIDNLIKAIACFQRSIISARSPYDRYHLGRDRSAIPESAKRGELLFFSGEKAGCFQCHSGITFSGTIVFEGRDEVPPSLQNTGLYNLAGRVSYPVPNTGLHLHTGKPEDAGKFRAPTLRNIAVTAPYMHDGSIATLEEVIDHYAAGGRTIHSGPFAGVGSENPNKSPAVRGFRITESEKRDLIAFLNSLTDEALLQDSRWSDPWTAAPSRHESAIGSPPSLCSWLFPRPSAAILASRAASCASQPCC
jgi:cytochrome c peroxidase